MVAVLLAGCSGSEPSEPRPAPSGTAGVGEPCPRIGDDPTILQGCPTEARGDFDGDGRDDLATVFAELGRDDMPVAWWLIVELTSDVRVDTNHRLRPTETYPRVTRAADPEDDGRDEIFVEIDGRVEVFEVDRRGLHRNGRSGP